MMHEQNHSETVKTDGDGKPYKRLPGDTDAPKTPPTRGELIKLVSEPMRKYAIENSCLTHAALDAAIQSGSYSRFLRHQNTFGIYVILTVSPEDESDALFWHCSMSILSSASGKAKTVNLWTTRERRNVRDLLENFLGASGNAQTNHFLQTKTALHITRKLNAVESEMIQIEVKAKQ